MMNRSARGSPMMNRSLRGSPVMNRSRRGSPMMNRSLRGSPVMNRSLRGSPVMNRSLRGSPVMQRSLRGSPLAQLNRSLSRGRSLNRSVSRGPSLNRSLSRSLNQKSPRGRQALNRSMNLNRSLSRSGRPAISGAVAGLARPDSTIQQELEKENDILHPARGADEHRAIARAETEAFIARSRGATNAFTGTRGLQGLLTSTDHFRSVRRQFSPNRSQARPVSGLGASTRGTSPRGALSRSIVVPTMSTQNMRRSIGAMPMSHKQDFSRGGSTIYDERKKETIVLNPAVHVDQHRAAVRRETDEFKKRQWSPTRRMSPLMNSMNRSLSGSRAGARI